MPRKINDCQGDQWKLDLTWATAEKLHEAGIDLSEALNGLDFWLELVGSPAKAFQTLAVLCDEQIKDRKLSREEFGRRFRGDEAGEAVAAFREEVLDFFPTTHSEREIATHNSEKAIEYEFAVRDLTREQAAALIQATNQTSEEILRKRLEANGVGSGGSSDGTSSNSAESQESSIPAQSDSVILSTSRTEPQSDRSAKESSTPVGT